MSDLLTDEVVLDLADVSVTYARGFGKAPFRAVSGVSMTVRRGETVSIVGESGSGKSTIGSAILGLQPVAEGSVVLKGTDISHATAKQRRALRTSLQAVFQDPFSSLDPSQTVGQIVGEPLSVARPELSGAERAERVRTILG